MISGFMVLKNALNQGYPFVEAVAASLPIVDEFLISEGFSADGTFEVLQRISQLNKKIKLVRQQWPTDRKYSVIGEVTNAIRTKCSYDYILSIQANEVIHEDCIELVKALPEICPNVETFSMPFVHFVKNYKFYEDFRLRFSKNLKGIVATGDAWSLGASKAFVRSEAMRALRKPRRLVRYVSKGVSSTYANTCTDVKSRAVYLPKPVYRYWSLFPMDYLQKCEQHAQMFGLEELRKDAATLKNYLGKPDVFWKEAARIRRKELDFHYPDALGMAEIKDHPKLMAGLLSDSNAQSYKVRDEVLDLIKEF